MSDRLLQQQAVEIVLAWPKLTRRLFRLDIDDPVLELPVGQLRVCNLLRDGSRAMTALSQELGISLSAITQIADRLERAGLVERISEGDDRRVKSLQLTARAVEMLRRRQEARAARVAGVLVHLSPDTRAAVLNALHQLTDAAYGDDSAGEDDPLFTAQYTG